MSVESGAIGWADFEKVHLCAGTVVRVEEFTTQSPASIRVQNAGKFTMTMPNDLDVLNVNVVAGNANSITGTSGGVGFIPFVFQNVNSLIIDAGTFDDVASNDLVTINNLVATGLENFAILAGEGDVPPLTHEILRRAEPDATRRPILHVGG